MKKSLICLSFLLIFQLSSFAEENNAFFISDPAISPDGKTIVFSYENNLWKLPAEGGTAYRLTSMQGREFLPGFSPDGKWIAFSASVDNTTNIYIVPAEGGEITQLTWHDANDHVDSWSWDSRYIYFSSSRYNMYSAYKVAVDGGTPVRLFGHYFNTPHHIAEHPQTNALYFTESWESFRFPQRKRYRGAHAPQIKSYNPVTEDFTVHTEYEGKDMWPAISAAGAVYFASDEANEEYNLYTFENGVKKQLTSFETSIGRPQVSANGEKIVFVKDYRLHLYDVSSGTTTAPDVKLYQQNFLDLKRSFNVSGRITSFDVSPDNKKIAFVSRGELFVASADGKIVNKLKTEPSERVIEVKWMKDSRNLIYSRTANGWPNWFTISADGNGGEMQITDEEMNNRQLALNNERTKGVYLAGRNFVKVINMETMESDIIADDELWGFQNCTPGFSPDGEYVIYTARRNFELDIFIHHLSSEKTMNITGTFVTQRQPFWSPCGKYIYFTSNRYGPSWPRGVRNSTMYRLPLHRFSREFKSAEFEKLFEQEVESEGSPDIIIDATDLIERWETIPVSGGQQFSPYVIENNNETTLLFASDHDKGQTALWKRVFKPFESPATERIAGPNPGRELRISQNGNNLYILAGGDIHKINLQRNSLEKIDISHNFSRNLRNEFGQMFYETWATIAENFYDKDFHGVDWEGIKKQYEILLPHIRQREDLRRLLNDMLGELNSSHMGFSSRGQEESTYFSSRTVFPGVLFSNTEPYRVKRIVRNSNLDLTETHVKEGDLLVAVDGNRVDHNRNREYYFSFPALPDELTLTFSREGEEFSVHIHPHTTGQLSTMLYDEWIADNRKYVDEKSDKRIAYVHMKNMSAQALNQFIIDMTSIAERRDALILDLRYNRGGNVHDDVLNFLSQRPYLKWQFREGEMSSQPNFAPAGKPIILLINERSLSDAEMTAAGFKELGLGTVMGTETYRWIIFTSGRTLVDGSSCRLPAWGCYTLDGENLEMTGVAPDIHVGMDFDDRLSGREPQLDMAIDELLRKLETRPAN